MGRKAEVNALSDVLADPAIQEMSADELAGHLIDTLDSVRSKTHRLVVVGQIQFPSEPTSHIVALGPFTSRGIVDSEAKLRKATEGGSSARQAGEGLAWDSKTGRGRGRFSLAAIFPTARAAWDFYRQPADSGVDEVSSLAAARLIEHGGSVCLCDADGQRTSLIREMARLGASVNRCPLHDHDRSSHA